MAKVPFDLSALRYSEFRDDKAGRTARGNLVGNIAQQLGVSRRQVNRIIDGSRRANNPLPKESVAKIRREIRKTPELFSEKIEGRAVKDGKLYLISRDTASSYSEAREIADQRKNDIEKPQAGGDSPTILDRAKNLEIKFIPPGGKYSEETRTGSKTHTAGAGGVFLVDIFGSTGG